MPGLEGEKPYYDVNIIYTPEELEAVARSEDRSTGLGDAGRFYVARQIGEMVGRSPEDVRVIVSAYGDLPSWGGQGWSFTVMVGKKARDFIFPDGVNQVMPLPPVEE